MSKERPLEDAEGSQNDPSAFSQGSAEQGGYQCVVEGTGDPAFTSRSVLATFALVASLGEFTTVLEGVADALLQAKDAAAIAETTLRETMTALGASGGALFRLSDDGTAFDALQFLGYSPATAQAWSRFPLSLPTPIGDAVRTRSMIVLASAEERAGRYPRFKELPEDGGSGALVALPLVIRVVGDEQGAGRVLGALSFSFPTDRRFSESESAFLRTVARLCALSFTADNLSAPQAVLADEAADSLLEEHPYQWLQPDDEAQALRALAHDGFWQGETQQVSSGSDPLLTETTVRHLRDSGAPASLLMLVFDRAALNRAEDALRLSEGHLRQAVSVTGFRTVYIDYRSNRSFLSPDAAALFGIPFDEIAESEESDSIDEIVQRITNADREARAVSRETVHAQFHPDDVPELTQRIAECLDPTGDGWFAMEHRVVHPGGAVRWLNVRKQVFFGTRNGVRVPHYALLVAADITAWKESEAARKTAEARLSVALDASGSGVFDVDCRTGRKLYAPRTFNLLGIPLPADFSQTSSQDLNAFAPVDAEEFWERVHPGDRERVEAALRFAYDPYSGRKGYYSAEYRVLVPTSGYRWIASQGQVTFAADGTPLRLTGMLRDITASRQASETLNTLYGRERTRAENAATLARIGAALRTTDEPEEVQARAAAILGEALGLDFCHATVLDTVRRAWIVARDWHRTDLPSLAGTYPLPLWKPLTDTVILGGAPGELGKTSVTVDVAGDPNLSEDAKALCGKIGVTSLVHVPFLDASGTAVAGLTAAMADGPRHWTGDEVTLIESVAALIRTSVEMALLHQRERNIAEQLQKALQPETPESLHGLRLASFYRPALREAAVGGDFSDVFPIEDENSGGGRVALVVADVSGKGLAAAQQVATVRNMLRYALYTGATISEAISTLNQTLVDRRLLNGFATLFLALYDPAGRTLRYVNCGQEPGLLRRAETGEISQLAPTGSVLGGFGEAQFTESVVTLQPGDVLLMLTDGLTEAGPSRRTLLEVEGVSEILRLCCAAADAAAPAESYSPARLVDTLMAQVDAFAGNGVRDDIALLVCVVDR